MTPGQRVTVVHGLPPHGTEIAVVRGTRPDGKILVQLGDGSGGTLAVDPAMIDVGNVHVSSPGARARSTDPETAHLAAQAASEHLTEHERLVLEAFVHAGRTGLIDHEIEARCGLIQTSGGVRRKRLRDLGLVEPTGDRRLTPSKRYANVHRITARGIAVYQHHRQQGAA
jgi:hypothetical protein